METTKKFGGGPWMDIPVPVRNTLERKKIGYISVLTPTSRIATNPVSYYFDDGYIYFLTPRNAKRYRFMEKKHDVTFCVDNGELLEKCAGIMIQGTVEMFSPSKVALSLKTLLPKFLQYIAKYPEGIPFYALGTLGLNSLPDERKLHTYNFIRLNPIKVFYWDGYEFGRISPISGDIISDDPVLLVRQALVGDFSVATDEHHGFDVLDVMNFSESVRKTILALVTLGTATPNRVATATSQTMSTERANLESLVRMGYAFKTEEDNTYILAD